MFHKLFDVQRSFYPLTDIYLLLALSLLETGESSNHLFFPLLRQKSTCTLFLPSSCFLSSLIQ